jgi:putative peptidoglycan lipid II flippase
MGSTEDKDSSPDQESHSVARGAGIVALAVMTSRVLGLVRDQVFAACFGAGFHNDAFVTAFRIPNLLRDLFAEGALSAAFVSTFSQVRATKGHEEAVRLSNRVATLLILIVGALCLAGWLAAPVIVRVLAPGFSEVPGKADLTVSLTRIMIPFLLLIALAAQAMGVLNAQRRFGIPALASSFFNIGAIAGGLFLGFVVGPGLSLTPIEGMAYGTLIGGFLQFAVQWPSLRSAGFSYRPMLGFTDPDVRQILRLMGPAIIGTAAVQVNVFINSNFASAIVDPATGMVTNGPMSWLFYAFRFMQFPIGVFGVAIATATLPSISGSIARKDIPEFRQTLAHSLGLVFLLCIPSAAGLAILGQPIVGLILEHGRFTNSDTVQTANALAAYSVGLAGYAAVKVMAPAFYALNDARTPMLISLGSIAVNYGMNSLLVGPLGHVGLALSTSTVALVNFVLLAFFMRRRVGRLEGRKIASTLVKVSVVSAAMAVMAWLVTMQIKSHLPAQGFQLYLAQVSAAMASAALVFYLGCRIVRVSELDEALAAIGAPVMGILRRFRSRPLRSYPSKKSVSPDIE